MIFFPARSDYGGNWYSRSLERNQIRIAYYGSIINILQVEYTRCYVKLLT
jgi:hypothetical protein